MKYDMSRAVSGESYRGEGGATWFVYATYPQTVRAICLDGVLDSAAALRNPVGRTFTQAEWSLIKMRKVGEVSL